jgi:hypothetical protein
MKTLAKEEYRGIILIEVKEKRVLLPISSNRGNG